MKKGKLVKWAYALVIFLLLAGAGRLKAQTIYQALPLMEEKPAKAAAIAMNYNTDSSRYAEYERFLRIYIILNYPDLSQTDFTLNVLSQKGKKVSTSIVKASEVSFDKKKATYHIKYKTGPDLKIIVESKKKIPEYDTTNYLTFSGTLSELKKNGTSYEIRLTGATHKIVGGPATVSRKEWNKVVKHIKKEDWEEAAALSREYMERFLVDTKGSQAQLRYIYLFSLAGMVLEDKMTYEELEKLIPSFVGQKIMTPSRQVELSDTRAMTNTIRVDPDDPDSYAVTAASGAGGSQVHTFEYVKVEDPQELKWYVGLVAYTGGRISSIELNPRRLKNWVMKVYIESGFIKLNN